MSSYIAEFLGTTISILLGDGIVVNVTLNEPSTKDASSIQITSAWSLTVMPPAFIFDAASGAHFNPALIIALVVDGSLAQALVPGYIVAQFAGAFADAVLVYLLSRDQFDTTESIATKLGMSLAGPSVPNMGCNILSEAIGAFVLVFAIKGTSQVAGIPISVDRPLVFGIIIPIGMSLGGLTGCAISPARDLGPRIAHAAPPTGGKGDSNWGYVPVAVIGPMVGVVAAVLLYRTIPWA